VHDFAFKDGALSEHRHIVLRDPKQRAIPAGIAVAPSGRELYAANVWGHRVTRVDLAYETKASDIPLGTNVAALTSAPVQPSSDFDQAAANKRAEASLYPSDPADTYPYSCLVDPSGKRLFVSLWAQAAVAVVDLLSGTLTALWPTEDHPCEMVLTRNGRYLFGANANRNTVSVLDTTTGKAVETIWAALYPKAPPGSTPNSLALSPDEKILFGANADNNAVAVFDVSKPGKSRALGFIPAGWYATSVRITPDGKHLLIASGRGTQPKANPMGPQPRRDSSKRTVEYIGGLYRGTLSILDISDRKSFEQQLAGYTADVYRCTPLRADGGVTVRPSAENPVPRKLGDASPIKYCIYIIKENRT
jgi:YVTN family beta-propeller protein